VSYGGIHGGFVGHVGGGYGSFHAQLLQLGGYGLELVGRARNQAYVHAFVGEGYGYGPANAFARARYEGHFSG